MCEDQVDSTAVAGGMWRTLGIKTAAVILQSYAVIIQ